VNPGGARGALPFDRGGGQGRDRRQPRILGRHGQIFGHSCHGLGDDRVDLEHVAPDRRSEQCVKGQALIAFCGELTGDCDHRLDRPRAGCLAPDLVVSADADEIRRIVINLFDNAVRYGGRPDRVRVATLGTERHAVLEVQDSGPGIAAADQEQMFEPFYRVRADARSPDGSCLGLAIARSLAERNGGRLTVASLAGSGSTFRLVLPPFT
jgi:signal transduction histidine kinase